MPPHSSSWAVAVLFLVPQVSGDFCENGVFCAPPKVCCGGQCCILEGVTDSQPYGFYHISFWNMWYFWFIVIFLVISCFGGCGYWRRGHVYLSSSQLSRGRSHRGSFDEDSQSTEGRETPFPPPHYSPRGRFPAPPPYSEVAAKPDMYPLVQGGPEYKDVVPPYAYSNTPYIHNFMQFNSGMMCASSPVESNCSSLPFSTNQANSVFPPPYSEGACAASNVSTPGSLLSAYTPTDVSSLHLAIASPPVATTPTSQRVFSELATPSEASDLPRDPDRLISAIVANLQIMTSRAELSYTDDDGAHQSVSGSASATVSNVTSPTSPGTESAVETTREYPTSTDRSSTIDESVSGSMVSGSAASGSGATSSSATTNSTSRSSQDPSRLPLLVLDCASTADCPDRVVNNNRPNNNNSFSTSSSLSSVTNSANDDDDDDDETVLHRVVSGDVQSRGTTPLSPPSEGCGLTPGFLGSPNVLNSPPEPQGGVAGGRISPNNHNPSAEAVSSNSYQTNRIPTPPAAGRASPSLFPWKRKSAAGDGSCSSDHSPSCGSHSKMFTTRFSTADDTVNLMECAIETDGYGDG